MTSIWHVGKWHLYGQFNSDKQPQPDDHGYDHLQLTQKNAAPITSKFFALG